MGNTVGDPQNNSRRDNNVLMARTVRSVPVFMQQQNEQPDVTEDHSTRLRHGKGPGYSRHTEKGKKISVRKNNRWLFDKNVIY